MDSCHKCGLSFSSNSIREVYTACAGKEADPNHREVTKSFTSAWKKLVDEPTVKLSITPKVHQISDHFSDYFEDPLVNGKGLGTCSDQIIEHMHSYIKKMMTKSMYRFPSHMIACRKK